MPVMLVEGWTSVIDRYLGDFFLNFTREICVFSCNVLVGWVLYKKRMSYIKINDSIYYCFDQLSIIFSEITLSIVCDSICQYTRWSCMLPVFTHGGILFTFTEQIRQFRVSSNIQVNWSSVNLLL